MARWEEEPANHTKASNQAPRGGDTPPCLSGGSSPSRPPSPYSYQKRLGSDWPARAVASANHKPGCALDVNGRPIRGETWATIGPSTVKVLILNFSSWRGRGHCPDFVESPGSQTSKCRDNLSLLPGLVSSMAGPAPARVLSGLRRWGLFGWIRRGGGAGQRRLRRVRRGAPHATLVIFLFNEHSENCVLEESICLFFFFCTVLHIFATQSVDHGPLASASLGSLCTMQIIGLHPNLGNQYAF